MQIYQGIDITSTVRIREAVEHCGPRFLSRVFTLREQRYCENKRMKYEHYAARFAAKEAVIKALPSRSQKKLALKDIEIRHYPTGKPYIHFSPAVKRRAGLGKNDQIELSMAHERDCAIATVLIVKT